MVDDVYDVSSYPYGYPNLEKRRKYAWENTNRASDAEAAKREEMKNPPIVYIETQTTMNAFDEIRVSISING